MSKTFEPLIEGMKNQWETFKSSVDYDDQPADIQHRLRYVWFSGATAVAYVSDVPELAAAVSVTCEECDDAGH